MEISKGAVGVLAAVCLTAGAAGAYLASGGSDPGVTEPTAQTQSVSPDPALAATGETGVEQCEGVIADGPAASAPASNASTPAATTAPAPRRPATPPANRPRPAQAASASPAKPLEPVEQPAPREEART